MSVFGVEGFDMYNGEQVNIGMQARWVRSGGTCTMVTGRFGGQAVQISASGAGNTMRNYLNFAGTYTSFGLGFAYKDNSTLASRSGIIRFWDASFNTLVSMDYDSSGGHINIRGPTSITGNGTILATASVPTISALNVWHYIEVYLTINATTGTATVYLDGASIISATGLNTGSAPIAKLQANPGEADAGQGLVDDMFFADATTHLGECKVETLRATGDSSVTWTPNSGANNYSRVNETQVDGDTSYVSTISTGVRDLYTFGALSTTPASILAVNVVAFAEKTDANTRLLYGSVRSASTDSDGAAWNLAAGYLRYDRVMTNDPATSAPWTASGVNNLLAGPKAA